MKYTPGMITVHQGIGVFDAEKGSQVRAYSMAIVNIDRRVDRYNPLNCTTIYFKC